MLLINSKIVKQLNHDHPLFFPSYIHSLNYNKIHEHKIVLDDMLSLR